MIVFFLVGVFFIVAAIYIKYVAKQYEKYAVEVKATVKKVEEIYRADENGNKILVGYNTTFQFVRNGEIKEQTLISDRRFKLEGVYEGVYLDKPKVGIVSGGLSVGGVGFYKAEGGEIILIAFGLMAIFACFVYWFNLGIQFILVGIIIFIIIIFGYIYFHDKAKARRTKEQIRNEEPEFSVVERSNLRRVTVNDETSLNVPKWMVNLFIILTFGCVGVFAVCIGIKQTVDYFDKQSNWPKTTAVVVDIENRTSVDSDGAEVEKKYIKYEYEVNGVVYEIEDVGSFISFQKINDKRTIFYDKYNPETSFLEESLGTIIFPIIIGLFFEGVMVYLIFGKNQREKILDRNIKMKEGN